MPIKITPEAEDDGSVCDLVSRSFTTSLIFFLKENLKDPLFLDKDDLLPSGPGDSNWDWVFDTCFASRSLLPSFSDWLSLRVGERTLLPFLIGMVFGEIFCGIEQFSL